MRGPTQTIVIAPFIVVDEDEFAEASARYAAAYQKKYGFLPIVGGANALYDKGREGFLDGSIDWDTDTIKIVGYHNSAGGTSYVPNLATDTFLSDIAAGARISTTPALTSKTVTAGVADAVDTLFATVASGAGNQIDGVAAFKDTGAAGTSRLIAKIDDGGGTLPVVPNNGDINVVWDNGANKIFKL